MTESRVAEIMALADAYAAARVAEPFRHLEHTDAAVKWAIENEKTARARLESALREPAVNIAKLEVICDVSTCERSMCMQTKACERATGWRAPDAALREPVEMSDELPPLPDPFKPKPSMHCSVCGKPYEPSRAIAPMAAAGIGPALMTSSTCVCGNSSFTGVLSTVPVALFTADQMRDYARRAIIAAAGGRK